MPTFMQNGIVLRCPSGLYSSCISCPIIGCEFFVDFYFWRVTTKELCNNPFSDSPSFLKLWQIGYSMP